MLMNYSGLSYPLAPVPGRWARWWIASVVLGTGAVTFAVSSAIAAAPVAPPVLPQIPSCSSVFPGAVNIVGALEGQPPIPCAK